MDTENILEFHHVGKRFSGIQALDDVTFSVHRGEVHAVMGENGAGKSTLMKVVAGLIQPDSGELYVNGRSVKIKDAHQALQLGIAMVPQELNLVSGMSIAENILLGMEPRNSLGVVNRQKLNQAGI